MLPFDFADLTRLTISACGTAYLAGAVAKYWFERYARLPVDIDVASEFRYREPPLEKGGLSLFISQSGETADTLAACAIAPARASTSPRWSIRWNRPLPANRAWCFPSCAVPKSASPRPRR